MKNLRALALFCIFGSLAISGYSQTGGLVTRPEVGPYLDGNFPSRTPDALNQLEGSWSVQNAFPSLTFNNPMIMLPVPGTTDQLILMQKSGQLVTFTNDPATTAKTTLLDIEPNVQWYGDSGFLGLAFHPEYGIPGSPNNSYIYLYYRWQPELLQGNIDPAYMRLSRFTWVPGSNQIDPASELVLINQFDAQNWHQGGGIFFGDDGFLYLSVGDEGYSNDFYNVAQKLDLGLFSGVLRIDVDMDASRSHPIRRQPLADEPQPAGWTEGTYSQNYYIPNDNPWLDPNGGILEEFYALGLRNPHRMTKDDASGNVWISDVGQGDREEIDKLVKGANYQWPYMEGSIPGAKPAPAPEDFYGTETGPVYDYSRSVGGCVIGGHVYRGTEHSPLIGKYIFADYNEGTIFALSEAGGNGSPVVTQLVDIEEHCIYGFGIDHSGEVYVIRNAIPGVPGSNGVILKFAFDGGATSAPDPPALLSATNAFSDLASLTPTPGLIPYDVIQPLWSDGAQKKRWLSIPYGSGVTDDTITFSEEGNWVFPIGTVLVKHFERDGKRLETRFMVKDENASWYGVTYRWNAAGTDASLLTSDIGLEEIHNVGGNEFTWYYPSRSECFSCHSNAKGRVLGVKTRHLNRDLFYPSTNRTANQLVTLNELGMFAQPVSNAAFPDMLTAVHVGDTASTLEKRFRSYIDINCSQCHTEGGITHARFEASLSTPLFWQNLINAAPLDPLGIDGSKIIYPGDETLSILYKRLTSLEGCCAMPPLAKNDIDQEAAFVVQEWIQSLVPSEVPLNDVDPSAAPADIVTPIVTLQSSGTSNEITATFSEPVGGLTQEEIVVSNGTVDSLSGVNLTRTISITPDGSGDVTVAIPKDTFHDVNGNANETSASIQIPIAGAEPGMKYEYYEGNFLQLPDFASLTPVATGTVAFPDLGPRLRDDVFAMRFTGTIQIQNSGLYTFHLTSDDGSRLKIDGNTVIDHDDQHASETKTGQVSLVAGEHDIEVQFFEFLGGQELLLEVEGPGLSRQPVSSDILSVPVPVPVDPVPVDPAADSGLTYQYYEGFFQSLPYFDALNATATGQVPSPDLSPRLRDDFFAMRYYGYITVPTTGTYTFHLSSDDGSRLHVAGQTLIDKNGLHDPNSKSGEVALSAGSHPFLLEYFEKDGNENLVVEIEGPGLTRQTIPPSMFSTAGPPEPDIPDSEPALQYTYVEGDFQALPDFTSFTPLATGLVYTPDLTPRLRDSKFAMQFTGTIRIPASGDYQFHLTSDDGSRLTIDSNVVVDNDGLHATETLSNTVTLSAGDHAFVLEFFENEGEEVLALEIEGPALPRQNIPASFFVSAASAAKGLTYQYYEGNYSSLPDFSALDPVAIGTTPALDLSPRLRNDLFAMQFAGKIRIPTTGMYTFYLTSDDGSKLKIGSNTVIDHDGLHAANTVNGEVTLTAGMHDFLVQFFEAYGDEVLLLEIEGPGIPRQLLGEAFFRDPETEFSVNLSTTNGQVNNNFSVDITFSEPATGLTPTDFSVTNGTPAGLSSISDSQYFVMVNPETNGAVTVQLPPGAAQNAEGDDSSISNLLTVYYDPDSQPGGGNGPANLSDSSLLYNQTWTAADGSPVALTREALVQVPEGTTGKVPVAILLHGSGGTAEEMLNTYSYLDEMILVSCRGYQTKWNVDEGDHFAPDVDFIRQVIYTLRTYDNVDIDQITLLGFSSGSALVNRLTIELEADMFATAIGIGQQLRSSQYHSGSFWWDPNGQWDYTSQIVPAKGRRILNLHGSDDEIIPYNGDAGDPEENLWLSNPESIFRLAEAMGYTGIEIPEGSGEPDGSAVKYSYLDGQVVHYRITGGNHRLEVTGEGTAKAEQIIADFLGQSAAP
ncbi:MAG: PA14 domain-containing protein [Verrucomicrobiales bacterium]|nr:PA14 domain-containing protein [Verrucomicrobiales bacterium]